MKKSKSDVEKLKLNILDDGRNNLFEKELLRSECPGNYGKAGHYQNAYIHDQFAGLDHSVEHTVQYAVKNFFRRDKSGKRRNMENRN